MQESNNLSNDSDIKLTIDRLYVKEISCRLPHAPGLFETPEFKEAAAQLSPTIEMNVKTQGVANQKYEVVLQAIVQAKSKNIILFVLEVQQAGIFTVEASAEQLEHIIKNTCVSLLYPYLNQVITNAVVQSGFPPLILQPMINAAGLNSNKTTTPKKDFLQETIKPIQGGVLEKDNFRHN